MTPTIVAIIAVVIVLFLIILSWLVPIGLWITAIAAGVKVGIFDLVAMRLRRVPPAAIVEPQINATKAGVNPISRRSRSTLSCRWTCRKCCRGTYRSG